MNQMALEKESRKNEKNKYIVSHDEIKQEIVDKKNETDVVQNPSDKNETDVLQNPSDKNETDKLKFLYDRFVNVFNNFEQFEFKEVLYDFKNIVQEGRTMNRGVFDKIIDLLNKSKDHTCFFFFSTELYNLYLLLLYKQIPLSNASRMNVFNGLRKMYDKKRLFGDLFGLYDNVDNFYAHNELFKNYMLKTVLNDIMEHVLNEIIREDYNKDTIDNIEKNKNSCMSKIDDISFLNKIEEVKCDNESESLEKTIDYLTCMSGNLDECAGFAEFLCRNIEEKACRNFLVIYLFNWLRNMNVDLQYVTKKSVLNSALDSRVINRIFRVYADLVVIETTGTSGWIAKRLFGCEDAKKVFGSIYKRLFNYFLVQNKKIFKNVKVLKVFSKIEIRKIYKLIHTNTDCFVNIFIQLNPFYLVKEFDKTLNVHIFNALNQLINNNAFKFKDSVLKLFYQAYFRLAGKERDCIAEIRVKNIFACADAFMETPDKSVASIAIIRYIKNSNPFQMSKLHMISSELNLSEMLKYFAIAKKYPIVPPVYLAATILENPKLMAVRKNLFFYKNILITLANIAINTMIKQRLFSLLIQLMKYEEYSFEAGLLLQAFCGDRMSHLLTSNGVLSFQAMAIINHPHFQNAFAYELNKITKDISLGYHSTKVSDHTNNSPHIIPSENSSGNEYISSVLQQFEQNNPKCDFNENDFFSSPVDNNEKKNCDENKIPMENKKYKHSRENINNETSDITDNTNTTSTENISSNSSFSIMNALIYYAYHDQTFFMAHSDLFIWLFKNNNAPPYNQIYAIKTFLWLLENMTVNSPLYVFVSKYPCFFHTLFQSGHYISQLINIFINHLRLQAILPCSAIPYLMCFTDADYIYNRHPSTLINSIPTALNLVTSRIKDAINAIRATVNRPTSVSSSESYAYHYPISNHVLSAIMKRENPVPFIYLAYTRISKKNVLLSLPNPCNLLTMFIILNQMRFMDKEDKISCYITLEMIAENEYVLNFIYKARDFYNKSNKGIIPIEYICDTSL